MRRLVTPPRCGWLILAAAVMSGIPAVPATARETVDASAPQSLAVTLYRDPNRGESQAMNRNWPQGFAMITETRQVTVPPGETTIRFEGVAEGMVAVSAIVTGLPGGTLEKNRNADLLSPAALVDGTLGNRVTITRTNRATGAEVAEEAVVRTRADGGLVLQTADGFEAVRCSGLPERLTFDRVPQGLSAQPVYSINTNNAAGGTYTIQLTYLAWGFDWQAHYVAQLAEGGDARNMRMGLTSWLTLLNDNGQSFPDAELLVVAGKLNVTSDYRTLAAAPQARGLQLTCYPLGSTAAGTPVESLMPPPPPPPPPPAPAMAAPMMEEVVVTGSRLQRAGAAMVAVEEQLGDLKLFRVPERVTVSAKGLKQVAFLQRDEVKGQLVYQGQCDPWNADEDAVAARMRFETVNDKAHGLGVAMPMGGISFFEPSSAGELLVAEQQLRDHAEGQDVEIDIGESAQVFVTCDLVGDADPQAGWANMRATITNANPTAAPFRLQFGQPGEWVFRQLAGLRVKDGMQVKDVTVPANGQLVVNWRIRSASLGS
ncbi:hypothetical protein GRI97_07915 [Altererythrobacter xixiisoli]|uniref:DUF4139 domain-containing protein n=1 Tax=Croceibacterium xixiisoli TaxID=1476466 RepID=A0A6I4TUQ0_9SPHN|nr:hypothetical protein [Croceibacterium xixiisoli]MXO98911.1 hypothetical protein [Croceibacterium xixiisoli]